MGEQFEQGKSYWLPLDQVNAEAFRIREKIGGPEFEELKKSLAEQGQLQPVAVLVFMGTKKTGVNP